ncbi:hypothetical protein BGX26_000891 [Mortierella sp. AD094]|nr:hypothetical protein BGX26_000891 [Mortierella sp. AD094]
MPKSSSKRKKEKNADFKKTKLKVGKKKAVADSFTDTSFKSKAISLPSQSISHDKTALLTNSRNVTFAELITQLKHYSPGTRKDALLGLRDLFHRHPHLLPLHLGVLVNTIVRLLIDDSSVVRKALQSFLGEFIPTLHPRDVQPFLPLLIVYTCSAMTHILEDIREDALKFMDLWIAAGGQIVVNGFWDKIIPNYVSLLTSDSNASNASKFSSAMSFSAPAGSGAAGASGSSSLASKATTGVNAGKNAPGSQKAKSDVLQSLAGFLQEGLGGNEGEKDPYWFLRNSLGTGHARKSFNTSTSSSGKIDQMIGSNVHKKRKSPGSKTNDRASGRSTRRKADDEANSSGSEEEVEEDSMEESESDEESLGGGEMAQDESLVFDSSPVVSFSHGQRNHQLLATFPIHPSIAHSSITQTVFGTALNLSRDLMEADCIDVKIFPQKGGAPASGIGANTGSSESENRGKDNLGGVQGRLSQIKPLISTLHPLLLSVWLDTAPTVFASSTSIHANHALTIVHLVLKIWGILWRAALARPKKKKGISTEEEQEQEIESERWLDEYLQSLLRHVLIYFPFGKDTVGVAAQLQEMNTTYCELTSLFLLESGVGRIRRVHKHVVKKLPQPLDTTPSNSWRNVKTSYRPSNKDVKRRKEELDKASSSSSSSDYDSEDDEMEPRDQPTGNSDMMFVQVETPPWADQVVDFVLDSLGWVNPENQMDDSEGDTTSLSSSQMTSLSTDFKSQHLVALLPTLWTLLNCLEARRKEWVFEALMKFFENAHVQSSSKKTVLQFLALVIKLQSHPHYTGSFSIMIPGVRAGSTHRSLIGLSKKNRKEQRASITKMSDLLASTLLKLPKLLWDLGTERVETTQTILDLLAWITVIAGDRHVESAHEEERIQFLKTFQSYMALFFCVTVAKGGEGGKRTIMGPFVNLPPTLQRRAIEIVFYSGAASSDEHKPLQKKKGVGAHKQSPLLAAVRSCCEVGDLSEETKLYVQETLGIVG